MTFKQLINFRKHIVKKTAPFSTLKNRLTNAIKKTISDTVNTKLNKNAWFSLLGIVSYQYVKCSFPRLHGISFSLGNIAHLHCFFLPPMKGLNEVSSMSSVYKVWGKFPLNGNIYIFKYISFHEPTEKPKKFNF